ncbi:MAG: hypothetical protein ACRDCE_17190 [Cetobacterium sp.]|uniref:hypothetical protein n=1 Tax=Cetobacterium sp. TaxID=2071632 RepID=UPI003EE7B0D6
MKGTILSLDQSTSCVGWSVYTSGEYVASGIFEPDGLQVNDKLFNVFMQVKSLISEHKADVVTLEDIWLNEAREAKGNVFKSNKSFGDNVAVHKVLGELLGACKMAAMASKVNRVVVVSPQTWKSRFKITGKGWYRDKQKEAAIKYAEQISRKKITTNDEGDAVCMGYWASKELYNMKEELRAGEFKIPEYPHTFKYFDKKDFNDLSRRLDVKFSKTAKEVIGKNPNGTNKWGMVTKELYADEVKTLNQEQKLAILEGVKAKGFKSELAKLVWEEQYKFIGGTL